MFGVGELPSSRQGHATQGHSVYGRAWAWTCADTLLLVVGRGGREDGESPSAW